VAYTEDKAFELISAAHERGRLSHAFLITGDQHAGVERLAARVAQMLNEPTEGVAGLDLFGEAPEPAPKDLDDIQGDLVRVIRPQSKSRRISKEDIRDLEKALHAVASKGKWKIGIVLDADRMGVEAENAFLKTLEEPPPACLLMLITNSPQRLLPTILSRCVRLPLMSKGEDRVRTEAENKLLQALAAHAKQGFGSLANALTLKGAFSTVLTKRKSEISKEYEASLKEEVALYKQTTEGDWLKRREEYYKALTESEYLQDRAVLIDVLITWLGDVVRGKCDTPKLDYSDYAQLTSKLAASETMESLLNRMDSIEELRSILETNAQEQLALEVGFMKAFS